MSPLSRRDFIAAGTAAGAGLVIGFYLPHGSSAGSGDAFSPNAYLKITPDNKVTIVVARSEMGQGVRTSLPMILAEELEADWKQIQIEQAGASTLFGDQTTGGSASVRTTWDPMRRAGAAAREMLISAGALHWNVARASCKAENGTIVHAASNGRATYGELASKAATLPVPTDVTLKQAKDYKIVGKPLARLDTPPKVNGTAVYGIDFRVPDMKYAVLARCPIIGGKVASFDDKESKKVSGVSYVGKITDSSIAIVADSVWSAMEGPPCSASQLGRRPQQRPEHGDDHAVAARFRGEERRDALFDGRRVAKSPDVESKPHTNCPSWRMLRWNRATLPLTCRDRNARSGRRPRSRRTYATPLRPRWVWIPITSK